MNVRPPAVLCRFRARREVGMREAPARRSPIRRAALTALAFGVLLGAALVWRGLHPAPGPAAPLPAAAFDVRTAGGPRPSPEGGTPGSPARSDAMAPTERDVPEYGPSRLGIPSLGVDAPVVPEPVGRDGELVIPGDPTIVGRWDAGPDVDALVGTTVLAGHVSVAGVGAGALRELHRIGPGALVVTTSDAGEARRWRVDALLVRAKDDLPDLPPQGPRRLVIVTCGGPLLPDRSGVTYRDNVLAYASPA